MTEAKRIYYYGIDFLRAFSCSAIIVVYVKVNAIFTFLISIIINYFCVYYFFTERFVIENFAFRHNFLYCVPFMLGGVIVYLYKDSIERIVKKAKICMLIIMLALVLAYYIIPDKINDISVFTLKNLVLFCAILSFSLGGTGIICNNKIVSFLSSISLELYLCHMLVFRGIEKLHLLNLFGDGWLSFGFSSLVTISLSIMFVEFLKSWKKNRIQSIN